VLFAVAGAAALLVTLALSSGSLSEAVQVQVAGSLVDVRPGIPLPVGEESDAARILAARNEFESFQVAVRSQGTAVGDVSVAAGGPLVGPGGARIGPSSLTVYREGYYDVRVPSDSEGARGEWPDPLIPARDYLYGERRDAFPADAPSGGDVVAWVDVLVPRDQAPGVYRGNVSVAIGGERPRAIPVQVRVLPFGLPSTSTMRSAFPAGVEQVCESLDGASCDASSAASWRAQYLVGQLGLENRLTVPDPSPAGPQEAPKPGRETSLYRRYALPLIDGARRSPVGGPRPRLAGARLTSVEALGATYASGGVPTKYWCAAPDSPCLARWHRLASQGGFAGRLFLYLCDEPGGAPAARWPVCHQAARGVRDGPWPSVARLVTTWIQQAAAHGAESFIDTMVVGLDKMANKPGYPLAGSQRPAYDAFLRAPGRSIWIYTACLQYSCDRSRSPYWTGWPGYGIDQPPSQARAMGWLAYLYGASGELYYDIAARLSDAWRNSYQFGGNGDGTLLYPGLPHGDSQTGAPAIGGTRPIPLESIRLKRLRDGREDYEYLRLAAKRGEGARAARVVTRLLGPLSRATFSTTFSQRELDMARCRVAHLISPGVGACH
jgi:hypothetical protein